MRDYLKIAREKLDLTQFDISQKLSISQNYYCDIENGVRQRELKASIISGLSDILNIPVSEILEEERKIRKEI